MSTFLRRYNLFRFILSGSVLIRKINGFVFLENLFTFKMKPRQCIFRFVFFSKTYTLVILILVTLKWTGGLSRVFPAFT